MPDESANVHVALPAPAGQPRRVYAPIAAVVAACFCGVMLLNPSQGGLLSSASAQPAGRTPEPGEVGLISAAEQRKEIISQLKALNGRMERVESIMSKGLSVKVTEMPAIKIPREEK